MTSVTSESAVEPRESEKIESALYVVATPIGHLGDITLRALQTLRSVDVIAAEDTRVSRGLLSHFGIGTRLIAVHEHNEKNAAAGIVNLLNMGQSVALITDAGTPAVSDPGAVVVRAVHEAGKRVIPIPGASAMTAALSASGLGDHGFSFVGFLPAGKSDRAKALHALAAGHQALVFYESPHRVVESVGAMRDILGAERDVAICRELTKKFETIHRTTLAGAVDWLENDTNHQRGEFVIVVSNSSTGAPSGDELAKEQELERTLAILCAELPLKQAVSLAVQITGEKKNKVYDMALALKKDADESL